MSKLKKIDYRHFVCIGITLGFILLGILVFFRSFVRLGESFRDFGYSMGVYFTTLMNIDVGIKGTVVEYSSTQSYFPVDLPAFFEGFVNNWSRFWELFGSRESMTEYSEKLGFVVLMLTTLMFFIVLLAMLIMIVVRQYARTNNNDYGKESIFLRGFKKVSYVLFRPVKLFFIGLWIFLKNHKWYFFIWGLLFCIYFNILTIIIEFISFLFYFAVTFDVASIYVQLRKAVMDLSVFQYIPIPIWIMLFFLILSLWARHRAYDHLDHNERRNRGFLNGRGVVNNIYGYVGAGKTALITDIALSYEVQFLDDALEIILETDMYFPYVDWNLVEKELKTVIAYHVVYDKWSIRRWILKKRQRFEKSHCRERIFGYDYERYSMTYDNKLESVNIWQALENYCCAYFIYTIQSSYMISNFSIRSDKLVDYVGNFPLWNTNFFRRDSRLIDSFSRHAHIIDYDMMRLGKTMLENNPNRNAFGFGIYINSEIDKERKNMLELQQVKRNAEECNQKNDMYNACVKVSRHACVVANRVFTRWLGDLQRVGSLGADSVQLGDLIEVCGKTERLPVLPWYSPFWALDGILYSFVRRFYSYYMQYKYIRADNTLFMYLLKGFMSVIVSYHVRTYNLFGCEKLMLRIQSGFQNDKITTYKWYRQSKKIWSKRYATDCMSSIFESRSLHNDVGIDDLPEYVGLNATADERDLQNSYIQRDIQMFSNDPRYMQQGPTEVFYYLSNDDVVRIDYNDVTELKDMIWQKYDSGEITENVYKQVLGRLQKYHEDVDPVEDFQDWLTGLYLKGGIKQDAYKDYYSKSKSL